jgi:hypothetical protein
MHKVACSESLFYTPVETDTTIARTTVSVTVYVNTSKILIKIHTKRPVQWKAFDGCGG